MAYHFEKPMLVTAVGGLPEIVPDGKAGYVTEPNAKAIADGILRFLSQPPGVFSNFIREQKGVIFLGTFRKYPGHFTINRRI